jgi:hypothetical protein
MGPSGPGRADVRGGPDSRHRCDKTYPERRPLGKADHDQEREYVGYALQVALGGLKRGVETVGVQKQTKWASFAALSRRGTRSRPL